MVRRPQSLTSIQLPDSTYGTDRRPRQQAHPTLNVNNINALNTNEDRSRYHDPSSPKAEDEDPAHPDEYYHKIVEHYDPDAPMSPREKPTMDSKLCAIIGAVVVMAVTVLVIFFTWRGASDIHSSSNNNHGNTTTTFVTTTTTAVPATSTTTAAGSYH